MTGMMLYHKSSCMALMRRGFAVEVAFRDARALGRAKSDLYKSVASSPQQIIGYSLIAIDLSIYTASLQNDHNQEARLLCAASALESRNP